MKRQLVPAVVLGTVVVGVAGLISTGAAQAASPTMFDQVEVLAGISGSVKVVNMNLDEDCIAVSAGVWSQEAATVPAGTGEDIAVNLFPGNGDCQGDSTKIVRRVPENTDQLSSLWLDVR